MRYLQMVVRALTNDPETDETIAWLGGVYGKVILPFAIWGTPAVSIHLSMSGEQGPRPLTHDLIASCLDQVQARVQEVRFDEFEGEVLDAKIVVGSAEGRFTLRARPGDAIALALKCDAPIFLSEAVLFVLGCGSALTQPGGPRTNPLDRPEPTRDCRAEAADPPEAASDSLPMDTTGMPDSPRDFSKRLKQLGAQLEEAVRDERYEQAGTIKRQIISIRERLRQNDG